MTKTSTSSRRTDKYAKNDLVLKMGWDLDLVLAEVKRQKFLVRRLGTTKTSARWTALAERYARDKAYSFQFWDVLDDAVSFTKENGWLPIKEFISPLEDVFLFFEHDDENESLLFRHGAELAEVLIETGIRDFYLSDRDSGFLICYNDHDAIIADGIARDWLFQIRNRHVQPNSF